MIEKLLAEHTEEYDLDYSDHGGCSCGVLPEVHDHREFDGARAAYRAHLAEMIDKAAPYVSTRWWRAVALDGSVWCESSDEQDVRFFARETDTIMRLERKIWSRWVVTE